ncbi:MAG: type II toxin-antitoxin system HicA family toxin [Flavobacteriales bacterium]
MNLLKSLGFEKRVKGSHHIFYKSNIYEIINVQEYNGKAKPYQVKQIRVLILKYKLKINK